MEDFKLPEYLNFSWLTKKYVEKNAWYPVCDEWLKNNPENSKFENTEFGKVPWKSRGEYKPGDIIIFHEFDEWIDENGEYNNDRFIIVEKEDIEGYKRGERDMLPVGVVVHAKKSLFQKISDFFLPKL